MWKSRSATPCTYLLLCQKTYWYIIVQLVVHIVVSENLLVSHISISTASNIKNFDRIDCWRWGYSFSMRTVGHFFSHENALEFVNFFSSKKLWIVWGNIIIQDYSHSFFLLSSKCFVHFCRCYFFWIKKIDQCVMLCRMERPEKTLAHNS